MKNDFLERNQRPSDPRRTAIIDLFIKRAGAKLADVTDLAEELQQSSDCSFERALADALEVFKLA